MRREGRRHARQKILQVLVGRQRDVFEVDRHALQLVVGHEADDLVQQPVGTRAVGQQARQARAVPPAQGGVLNHRHDGDARPGGADEIQRALVQPGLELKIGAVQRHPAGNHPVQVFQGPAKRRPAGIVLALPVGVESDGQGAAVLRLENGGQDPAGQGSLIVARPGDLLKPALARGSREALGTGQQAGLLRPLDQIDGGCRRASRQIQAGNRRRQRQARKEAHRNNQDGNAHNPGQYPDPDRTPSGGIEEDWLNGHGLLIQSLCRSARGCASWRRHREEPDGTAACSC